MITPTRRADTTSSSEVVHVNRWPELHIHLLRHDTDSAFREAARPHDGRTSETSTHESEAIFFCFAARDPRRTSTKQRGFILLLLLISGIQPNPGPSPSPTIRLEDIRMRTSVDASLVHVAHFNMNGILTRLLREKARKILCLGAFASGCKPDIILIGETKVPQNFMPLLVDNTFPDYTPIWQGRPKQQGGGVGMLVRNDHRILDNASTKSHIENIQAHIKLSSGSTIAVTVAYRSPESCKASELVNFLASNMTRFQTASWHLVSGDLNWDLLDEKEGNKITSIFTDFGFRHAFAPTITRPDSLKHLDHIWTTAPADAITMAGTTPGLSDHYGVSAVFNAPAKNLASVQMPVRLFRNLKAINPFNFNRDLISILGAPGPRDGEDSQTHCDRIESAIKSTLEKHAPYKLRSTKKRANKRFCQSSYLSLFAIRKQRRLRRAHQRKCYKERIEDAGRNPKKLWTVINDFRPKKSNSATNFLSLSIAEAANRANEFNNYFASVGRLIAEKLKSKFNFTRKAFDGAERFAFYATSPDDVSAALAKLKAKPTTGFDQVPECVLKLCAGSIAPHLSCLFNQVITDKRVPLQWKTAVVSPLYKEGTRGDVTNYRPISILSPTFRTFERCLAEQIRGHLDRTQFLARTQFGFRRKHSTDNCLTKLTDDWRIALGEGDFVVMVSLDLSKAFDTLHPSGVIASLRSAGFDDDAVDLMGNYLAGRQQVTKVNDATSNITDVFYGVPQGSVLGPLLFTIFVNEMSSVAKVAKISQYADDTVIYMTSGNHELPQWYMQKDLDRISRWLTANSLLVNGKKSQLMILSPHKEKPTFNFNIDGQPLETSSSVKILGFILDDKLLLKEHVKMVKTKTRSGLFALKLAVKHGLSLQCLKMLANGLIFSHLHYCDTVLGQASKTVLQSLQSRQDQVIRAFFKLGPWACVEHHRNRLGWLDLEGKRKVHITTLVYRSIQQQAPKAIGEMFSRVDLSTKKHISPHDRLTNVAVPNWTNNRLQTTFTYRGAALWNTLPDDIHIAGDADICRQRAYIFFLPKN